MTAPGRVTVTVAVPTFRRPRQLEQLLSVLAERIDEAPHPSDVAVLVIDNDPEGGARALVSRFSDRMPLSYVHEPRPGIAAVRQRALDATVDRRLLVFIDDDEIPRSGWLAELLRTWQRTGAAAVSGHVNTVFPPSTDEWVAGSGLFRRPLHADGEELAGAGAGNLLLDLDQVRRAGVDFDLSLGLFGGEDTLFTRQLIRAGGRVVACPGSVADDPLEPERATRSFARRRARHQGQMQAVIDLRMAATPAHRWLSRIENLVKGLGWLGLGGVHAAAGALRRSLPRRARGERGMQRGLGLLEGVLGLAKPAYERRTRPRLRLHSAVAALVRQGSPVFRSVVGVRTARPVLVLTLDDGPDPEWTPRILDLLAERHATATFFVLLTRCRLHPDLLERIRREGHEIAFHGVDHRRITDMPASQVREMLHEGSHELARMTGVTPRWYRPPYGALSPETWRVVRQSGMAPVLWSTSALDGRDAPHHERIAHATRSMRPGTILLAHDARAGANDGVSDPTITPFDRAALLADILDAYAARGLRPVSLGEALRHGRLRRRMVLVR